VSEADKQDPSSEAYRIGYRQGQAACAYAMKVLEDENAASAQRIKALEGSIREALRRLNEYADMTLEEWDETIADNGAACWMLIRAQLKTVVVGDLNRAMLKEADQ